MPRGLEAATTVALPFKTAQFETVYAETELNEPQPGALFLVEFPDEQLYSENLTSYERCERAQRHTFDRRMGTLLLELNEKKILPKLMSRPQLEELYGFGFKQQKNPHITILSYCNGRRKGSLKIMASVECPAAADFYDRLEQELPELKLERDPLHITLLRKRGELSDYTNATIGGIAVGRPVHSLSQLYA